MASALIESFLRDGFVKLPAAVPDDVVAACALGGQLPCVI